MKALLHPFFIAGAVLYFMLKLTRHSRFRVPVVHDYLADFLCMPVVLSLSLVAMRFVQSNPRRRLTTFEIIAAVVLFAGLFEGLFPLISTRFTADILDVFMYAAGAFVFALYMNL